MTKSSFKSKIVGIEYRNWIPTGKNMFGNTYLKRWLDYNLKDHWIKRIFIGKLVEIKKFIKDKRGGRRFLPYLKTGLSSKWFL